MTNVFRASLLVAFGLLVPVSAAWGANWLLVTNAPDGATYSVDLSTVSRKGPLTQFWVKIDFTKRFASEAAQARGELPSAAVCDRFPQRSDCKIARETPAFESDYMAVRCAGRMLAILANQQTNRFGGLIRAQEMTGSEAPFASIPPESAGEALYKVICKSQ